MDVTRLLEQDHQNVAMLFDEYEQSRDVAVLEQVCDELTVHTTVEEELVYPRLEALDRDLEEHAEDEHASAKELIAQIRAGDPDTLTLAAQLRKAVEHHVNEEETKAFPLMRDSMADDLEALGSEVERRKQELQNTR